MASNPANTNSFFDDFGSLDYALDRIPVPAALVQAGQAEEGNPATLSSAAAEPRIETKEENKAEELQEPEDAEDEQETETLRASDVSKPEEGAVQGLGGRIHIRDLFEEFDIGFCIKRSL